MRLFPADVIQYVMDTLEFVDAQVPGVEHILKYLDGDALEAAKQVIEYGVDLKDMVKK